MQFCDTGDSTDYPMYIIGDILKEVDNMYMLNLELGGEAWNLPLLRLRHENGRIRFST